MMEGNLFPASFSPRETKDSAGTSAIFPIDLIGQNSRIFAFILGESREKGEAQFDTMIQWHQALKVIPNFDPSEDIFHIPVIEGLPFFLKGIVRNGMADGYQGIVDGEHIAVLFVRDSEDLFSETGIPFTWEPTLVVVDRKGTVTGYVKGKVSEAGIEKIRSLL